MEKREGFFNRKRLGKGNTWGGDGTPLFKLVIYPHGKGTGLDVVHDADPQGKTSIFYFKWGGKNPNVGGHSHTWGTLPRFYGGWY